MPDVEIAFQAGTARCAHCGMVTAFTDVGGRYSVPLPRGRYRVRCVAGAYLRCYVADGAFQELDEVTVPPTRSVDVVVVPTMLRR